MNEEVKVSEVMDEIKNADEDTLRETIEKWYGQTRTDGLRIGAKMISTVVYGAIKKHILIKKTKPSLRDYQRCVDEILKLVSVQLVDDSDEVETNEVTEEEINDGTAE